MSKDPVQTLKGFRDLLPAEKRKRDYVANKLRQVFEVYGFEPLETPTLEYASLLLGKYGEEADKLVYTFEDRGDRKIGLRYDQTVPTARVLAQYQNELPRYFRRYQIQNVFRADKPQKGRFREFTQCDMDIFGSSSPIADAEIIATYYRAYIAIGLTSIQIEVNDRQTLLSTLSPFASPEVPVMSIIQSIDKLDKLSAAEVAQELVNKGLSNEQATAAVTAIENSDGSDNVKQIVYMAIQLGVAPTAIKINPKIARGLDYYTGMIFEGRIPEYEAGSVGGGGRYDNLINDLAGIPMPAVGVAIGFDRTVEAAEQLGVIPSDINSTQVLVTVFDEQYLSKSLAAATSLREAGVRTEVYPAIDKLAKQFKLADQKQIPYVVIIGETEAKANKVTLKNMQDGNQETVTLTDLVDCVTRKS